MDLYDYIRRPTPQRAAQFAAALQADAAVRSGARLVRVPPTRVLSPLMYAVSCHNTAAVRQMLAHVPPHVRDIGCADALFSHPRHGRGDPTCPDDVKAIVQLLSRDGRLRFSRGVPCVAHAGLQAIVDQHTW